MTNNNFGKTSIFKITTSLSKTGDKTIVKDSFFTAPYKIMKPFERKDGGIKIFQQTASAGIMAGDVQEHNFIIEKNAILEIVSQSFEKIFKMNENEKAIRKISAKIEENATFIYTPQPTVPFEDSNFESETKIKMSKNAKLVYKDTITCGRKEFGEMFKFRKYKNLIEIKNDNKMIFRDNTVFFGSEKMKNETMFGSYSHLGTLLLIGFDLTSKKVNEMLDIPEKLLYINENDKNEDSLIGVSNFKNGICVKVLSTSAEKIESILSKIKIV